MQKNAGLAFIELVNEGRLHAHSVCDHLGRVGNEGMLIIDHLDRLAFVELHAEFEQFSAQHLAFVRESEHFYDDLVERTFVRDRQMAGYLLAKSTRLTQIIRSNWLKKLEGGSTSSSNSSATQDFVAQR